jgi:hypothetical protein
MRVAQRATWLVVGAVAAVALAAAVDALRGEGEAAPPVGTSPAPPSGRALRGSNVQDRLEDKPPSLPDGERVRMLLEGADEPIPWDDGRPAGLRRGNAGIEEVRRRQPRMQSSGSVDRRFGPLWR